MKKLALLFLTITMLIIICIGSAVDGYVYFNYDVNDDGSITITGCSQKDGTIIIPEEYDKRVVTAIGEKVFDSCKNIGSI